ncbi:MAG TPA: UvrD-helicase domain-containing protein [Candidatus Wunengus sp. YC63]|uniref:UvrD-helicase domain-containing protein n=1 Tax=Candidatus Wunengus sp. YC63 TaxID=3367699 RepID=UPI0040280250
MASVVEQVFDCIKNKESFVLDAGAGSGKTWTLVQALNYILETKSKELKNNGQKIVCITYTNIAKDEIIERTEHNELIHVSTIHDFLWECIKRFQSELKVKFLELLEENLAKEHEALSKLTTRAVKGREKSESKITRYKEAIERLNSKTIKINYDNFTNYKEGKFSHDALIVIAEKIFSSYPKIRKIITDTYPIIFVDEYQDTQEKTVTILLNYLKGKEEFTLGFFGDKRQQIYDTGIGEIPAEHNLKLIQKTENYRSSKEVIELLNKIRSDIQQYQPPTNIRRGEILFFHKLDTNDFSAKGFIEQHLKDRWSLDSADKVKILYLTHRFIAKENEYEELYQAHSKNADVLTKNKDNRGMSPYTDYLFDIEEIATLFNEKRIQQLLKKISFEMRTFDSKKKLNELLKNLIEIRTTKKIKDVIDFVTKNKILALTEKMKNYDLEEEEKKEFYGKLMDIDYSQFMRLYQVQQDNTPFSTKHNTKGDEFNNVLVIIDDNSWKQSYNFDDYFSNNLANAQRHYRTSNLFYVVCSRAKINLALVCVSPLSNEAKSRIKEWFQEANYIEINT